MIIVYTPAGGEPERYDARSLLTSEASIVARTIDQKWPDIKQGLPDEDLDAMRGIVWVLKKRHQPALRFGEFDPGVDEMVTRFDKTEIENWVNDAFGMLGTDPEVTTEVIARALREVPAAADDPEHARAYIEKCQSEAGGKGSGSEGTPLPAAEPTISATETSATSEASTSDSSPTS